MSRLFPFSSVCEDTGLLQCALFLQSCSLKLHTAIWDNYVFHNMHKNNRLAVQCKYFIGVASSLHHSSVFILILCFHVSYI